MPIKIATRFATVRDTARALGVSKQRSDKLVELVKETLGDYKTATMKHARTAGGYLKRKVANKSARSNIKRNAATTRATATKAKR